MARIDSLSWVLLVSNDPPLRERLSMWLHTAGSIVCIFDDGHKALRFLLDCRIRPAVLLVDARLPTIDGLTLRKLLLLQSELAQIPFVLMCDAERGWTACAQGDGGIVCLQKPFEKSELLSKLAPHLKQTGSPQEALSKLA